MASGRLILPIAEPVLGTTGLVTPGATLSVYTNGATSGTLASLFSDSALTVPIANPQTSDAAGRFYAQTTVIWASDAMAYGAVLHYPSGASLTFANIYTLGAQADISGLAPINSPTFTGVPQAPTPAGNDSSAKLATTAYVQGQGYAPLASPTFTGVPAAPTAAAGTNTTQLATTAFVTTAIGGSASYFQSGEIPIATGTSAINIAHGLGKIPARVQAFIRCKIANNGYPIGCEVPVNIDCSYQGGNTKSEGAVAFAVDATSVGYVMGTNGLTNLRVTPAGTVMEQSTAPAAPNWVFFIRAWAN